MQHIWRQSIAIKDRGKDALSSGTVIHYTIPNHIGLLKLIRRAKPQHGVYRPVFEDQLHDDMSLVYRCTQWIEGARSVSSLLRITNNVRICEKRAAYESTPKGSCVCGRTNLQSVACSFSSCASCDLCFWVFGDGMVTGERKMK